MASDSRGPTTAELRLLDVLWQHGPQTVRQVASALHAEPTPVQYRTVQVQLDRLEKKGFVGRDRSSTPHVFAAAVDRGRFIGDELQSMADKVCGGSLAPLLMNLAQKAKLSERERDALWQLLEGDDR